MSDVERYSETGNEAPRVSDAAYELAPPMAGAMIESLRGVGYSTATALADLIDNSISAGCCRR